jgi:tetratricopeptide (TPR) repeat protein
MKKLIILIIVIGIGFFWYSSSQRRAKAFSIQSSVYGAMAQGHFKDAIAYLEQNENQIKRPEDFLAFGNAYATIAEYIKKFNWKPQYDLPNADSIFAKAVDIMQRGTEIGKPDQNEVIYLYLSGIYWKKGDSEGQIQSIEQAASVTKSIPRKSFYNYYNAMRCIDRVRNRDQTREDTLLKEKGWKFLEEAIQIYPQNYEALMYMSKNTESKSHAAEYYEKAKAALQIYEKDAKKQNIYGTMRLLATFNPYQ